MLFARVHGENLGEQSVSTADQNNSIIEDLDQYQATEDPANRDFLMLRVLWSP